MSAKYWDAICYIDTNILIYLFDRAEPAKQQLSNDLFLHFHRTGKRRISVQVISEWRNTMVKKFSHLVDGNFRRRFIRYLGVWSPLLVTPNILVKADELCERYSFSPYDSIHVQCALELSCQYFLSEDMQDGLVIEGKLTIHNPYKALSP
jgi:predicted nucleic acid-binding protein